MGILPPRICLTALTSTPKSGPNILDVLIPGPDGPLPGDFVDCLPSLRRSGQSSFRAGSAFSTTDFTNQSRHLTLQIYKCFSSLINIATLISMVRRVV